MSTFAQTVTEWHDFYIMVGTAAATRFFLPAISLLGVVVIAILALSGSTAGFYWLVPVMIVLLGTGSRNAWDLLIGLRAAERDSNVSPRK